MILNYAVVADCFAVLGALFFIVTQFLYIKRTHNWTAIFWKGGPFLFFSFNLNEKVCALVSLIFFVVFVGMYLWLASNGVDPKGFLFN